MVGQGAEADALLSVARGLPHANRIVLHASDGAALADNHPAKAKLAAASGAAAFVCRGQSCSLPVTDTGCLASAGQLPAEQHVRLLLFVVVAVGRSKLGQSVLAIERARHGVALKRP